MQKTPNEIMRELNDPIHVHYHHGDREPHMTPLAMADLEQLHADAITLIQQLEATVSEKEKVVAELSGKIGQLEAERDAAVNDLHYLVNHPLSAGPCYACLHSKDCWRGGDCDPVNDDRWQWRGICKEGH